MKLNELTTHKVKLAPRAGRETPEQRQARREHAKKAIANNFKKGFIGKATHDRQMKDQEINEGTWSAPQGYDEAVRLKKLMSKPLFLDNAKDLLYNLVGDDDLFDKLDNMIERDDPPQTDVRHIVAGKLHEWLTRFDSMEWRDEWDPRSVRIIQNLIKQYR